MSILDLKKLISSFRFAVRGLVIVFRREQSFRIHLVVILIVVAMMIYFRVTVFEALAIVLVIAMVLVLEVINTIFERIVDILKPRLHPYAESVKDMMAATVLLASLGAVAVGLIVFAPRIIEKFS